MIHPLPVGFEGSTRDRLLVAGARLFAEKGFRETTVGDIEVAAGLQPRRGALYRHFPSKQALLEAAVRTHLEVIDQGRTQLAALPLADLRSEAVLMGRWFLAELDAERYLTRILEQDGARLPEVRDLIRERIVDMGYLIAEQVIRRWLRNRSEGLDGQALAVLLLGPLVNFRRSTWTFGAPPLNLHDERFLHVWADACVTLANQLRATT